MGLNTQIKLKKTEIFCGSRIFMCLNQDFCSNKTKFLLISADDGGWKQCNWWSRDIYIGEWLAEIFKKLERRQIDLNRASPPG